MQPEDGDARIKRASESVSELLRNRCHGEAELAKAEQLLEVVSSRSDIFTTSQMLHMLERIRKQIRRA
jgi:hypothetical protein